MSSATSIEKAIPVEVGIETDPVLRKQSFLYRNGDDKLVYFLNDLYNHNCDGNTGYMVTVLRSRYRDQSMRMEIAFSIQKQKQQKRSRKQNGFCPSISVQRRPFHYKRISFYVHFQMYTFNIQRFYHYFPESQNRKVRLEEIDSKCQTQNVRPERLDSKGQTRITRLELIDSESETRKARLGKLISIFELNYKRRSSKLLVITEPCKSSKSSQFRTTGIKRQKRKDTEHKGMT